jgi:hypothetical protein
LLATSAALNLNWSTAGQQTIARAPGNCLLFTGAFDDLRLYFKVIRYRTNQGIQIHIAMAWDCWP